MNFTTDLSDLIRWAEDLQKFAEELPAACSRAVNRTGDMMTTAIGRTLADETGLGVRDVESDFEVERATPDDPTYTLTVPSRITTLGEYAPRPTREGVSARPWGQRRVFPSTFDVRGEVYKRAGKAHYPIEILYGPNVAAEAWKGQTRNVAAEVINDVLPARLTHELGRLWPRSKG